MRPFQAIARTSFREFIRDRSVLACAFVAVALMALSFVFGAMSFSEKQRLLSHFGLSAIHMSGVAIVALLGAFHLHRELERQTLLLILARPIGRGEFLIGKFFGVFGLLFLFWLLLGALLFALLLFSWPLGHFVNVMYGILMEWSILLAFAMFLSTAVRGSIAALVTIGFFLVGNGIEEIGFFGRKYQKPVYIYLSETLDMVMPNLYRFNWRSVYFLENGVASSHTIWVTFHGLAWIVLFLTLAIITFRRKDLV